VRPQNEGVEAVNQFLSGQRRRITRLGAREIGAGATVKRAKFVNFGVGERA
jgi:hypothetical protein